MTNPKLAVIAAALWAGGFIGAVSLAHAVTRAPIPATAVVAQVTEPPHATLVALVQAEPAAAAERHFVLPTVEIVSKINRPVVAPVAPPHQRDISEMRCSDWRPLQQGGNSVQICE